MKDEALKRKALMGKALKVEDLAFNGVVFSLQP